MRLGFLLMAGFLASCAEPDLAVDIDLDVESCIGELAARLEVRVQNADGSLRGMLEQDDVVFPTGVQLTSADESTAWGIEAEVFDADGVSLGVVRARGDFGTRQASRVFHDECRTIACGEGLTCERGECVSSDLEASAAPGEPSATCPEWTFVAADGAASDCGTFDNPCESPQIIIERGVSPAGVIINVRGESTYGPFTVESDVSGPVHVRAWPGTGRPTFDGEDLVPNTLNVFASNTTLQGVRVIRGTEHGVNANFSALITNIQMIDVIVEDNGSDPDPVFNDSAGMSFNNQVADFLIQDCVFRNNRGGNPTYGLYVNKTSSGVIRGNRFEGNETSGLNLRESTEVLVTGNTFFNNGASGVLLAVGDVTLEHNRICGQDEGVRILDTDVVRFARNSVVDNPVGVSLRGAGTLFLDDNIVSYASDIGVRALGDGVVEDGANLYFETGVATSGFAASANDLTSDPAFVSREECSLERTADTPEGFGAE